MAILARIASESGQALDGAWPAGFNTPATSALPAAQEDVAVESLQADLGPPPLILPVISRATTRR